jgi:hypothetical protein
MSRVVQTNFPTKLQLLLKGIHKCKGLIESQASLAEVERTRAMQVQQQTLGLIERLSPANVESDQ